MAFALDSSASQRTAPNVLFVCTANQCRSPLAAAIFAREIEAACLPVVGRSAGLVGGGVPVPAEALRIAEERGLELAGHRSRAVDEAMIGAADLIVTMAREHSRAVVAMSPEAFARVATLGELATWVEDGAVPPHVPLHEWMRTVAGGRSRAALLGAGRDDVPDPLGRPLRVWRGVADLLEVRIARVVDALRPLLWPDLRGVTCLGDGIGLRVPRLPACRRLGRMRVGTTSIPGLLTFDPEPHRDARGFFSRTFDATVAREAGVDPHAFVQDSLSRSARGVVRGLHLRVGGGESKLVRCSSGAVFDVVVDLRPGSPAYGTWLSFDLSGERQNSIFVPAGCAHGFQALTDPADTSYRIDREHDPSEDLTIAYDDPQLSIPWPLPVTLMSDADRGAPPLAALGDRLATVRPHRLLQG